MFEEDRLRSDVDGKKVPAEKIVTRAKRSYWRQSTTQGKLRVQRRHCRGIAEYRPAQHLARDARRDQITGSGISAGALL